MSNRKLFGWIGVLLVSSVIPFAVSAGTWADPTRRDLEFSAEGITLRGWFYLPTEAKGGVPAVVMAHGFSAVKEVWLNHSRSFPISYTFFFLAISP